MATKHFGLSVLDRGWLQQETALIHGGAGCISRRQVVKELQDLLQLCFNYGINPLPALRKAFPAFDWEYCKQEGMVTFGDGLSKRIAKKADFIFAVSQIEFVIAWRRGCAVNSEFIFYFNRTCGQLGYGVRNDFHIGCIAFC